MAVSSEMEPVLLEVAVCELDVDGLPVVPRVERVTQNQECPDLGLEVQVGGWIIPLADWDCLYSVTTASVSIISPVLLMLWHHGPETGPAGDTCSSSTDQAARTIWGSGRRQKQQKCFRNIWTLPDEPHIGQRNRRVQAEKRHTRQQCGVCKGSHKDVGAGELSYTIEVVWLPVTSECRALQQPALRCFARCRRRQAQACVLVAGHRRSRPKSTTAEP
jgi:hypothetical protein